MDDKMEKVRNRIKIRLSVIMLSLLGFLLILSGSSYAYFTTVQEQEGTNVVKAGELELTLKDEGNLLSLTSAFPVSDEVGLASDGYSFTIENTGSLPATYEIKIENDEELIAEDKCSGNLLEAKNIKYSIDGKVVQTLDKVAGEELKNVILIDSLVAGESKNYNVKMWIDESSENEVLGKHYHGKITIVASQEEPFSEPNAPKLVEGMIPVAYDASSETWRKVDTNTSWYSYVNQEWANAVTVVETTTAEAGHDREYYLNADPGTPILMDDINTMWVWIPRYEYDYTNITSIGGEQKTCTDSNDNKYSCYLNPGEIKVNFINGTSNTASTDDYIVHPAFTFGEKELTGLWFAKFEPSNEEKKFTINAGSNSSYLTPTIKPNTTSWRHIQVANAFYASRKMQTEKYEVYGFKANDESYDTHMSKNIEWASVAYLSQSQYGKYGNNTYAANDKEVYINNCAQYITGIAGDTTSAEASDSTCTENTYETLKGQKASTTGNITGVYDMSGGADEYVMGAMDDGSNKPILKSSGFTDNGDTNKLPAAKYYDLYTSATLSQACDGQVCYGHALSETAGWYGDGQYLLSSTSPWFRRGGAYNHILTAGVFRFSADTGGASLWWSFRLALAPIEN